MTVIDVTVVTNWIISGFIGLFFGIISAWVTHRYQKERDKIAWEREKEKLQQQFQHDIELLEIQFQQRLAESEQQATQEQRNHIREELLKGVDTPLTSLNELRMARGEQLSRIQMKAGPRMAGEQMKAGPRMSVYIVAGILGLLAVIGIILIILSMVR